MDFSYITCVGRLFYPQTEWRIARFFSRSTDRTSFLRLNPTLSAYIGSGQRFWRKPTHTYIYTTHTQTNTHKHIQTLTHTTHIQTLTHTTHTNTNTHTHTQTLTHTTHTTHIQTLTHRHTNTSTHPHKH